MRSSTPPLLFALLFALPQLQAQTRLDSLMSRRVPTCYDYAHNGRELLSGALNLDAKDSARTILAYWRAKCDLPRDAALAELVVDLSQGDLVDSAIQVHFIPDLLSYREGFDGYDQEWMDWRFRPAHEYNTNKENRAMLDRAVRGTVERIEAKSGLSPQAADVVNWLKGTNDSLFIRLSQNGYEGTKLQRLYNAETMAVDREGEVHVAGVFGTWLPQGELSRLGPQTEIGLLFGNKVGRWQYDYVFISKFGMAQQPYVAYRTTMENDPDTVTRFSGTYIGMDVGYDLWQYRKHELQVTCGLGYDTFRPFARRSGKDEQNDDPANSANLNGGLEYRFYTNSHLYFGLQGRYHWLNYSTSDAVDMTGSPITVRLAIGTVISGIKQERARLLHHRYRH
jgi:hypothetical protein